ncbi:hypothetical protein KEH51_15015 [[Brevibacterium] frigoritolerans]|uniref:Uncharacterized protein n=1 Tax=Peribacillus frigoritolerans TaxID=450367 RepID=A0A941FP51_9BACI|nr:hypothetical protein [Peribacillus frigoritolerans]
MVVFKTKLFKVDWSGSETPVGAAGQVRPHRRLRRGGSPPAPRKASIWRGNQPHRTTW